MVKGISRRVIVVDSPDPKLFEQAIFIIRNDALTKEGVSPQQVLGEACALPGDMPQGRWSVRLCGGGSPAGATLPPRPLAAVAVWLVFTFLL